MSLRVAIAATCVMVGLVFQPGLAPSSRAAETAYVPVGTARTKKTVIALADVQLRGTQAELKELAKTLRETVKADLEFMDLFKFLEPAAFIEPAERRTALTLDQFKLTDWSGIGAEFLVKWGLTLEDRRLNLETHLYEVSTGKELIAKKYVSAREEAKNLAHTVANEIVLMLTGQPGIFLTKIAMSCDRTGKKEIYIMNFDGSNVKQITNHRSIAFAPGWSPDGTKIAYSLYTTHKNNIRNIDLFEFDFLTSSIKLLSNRRGINSGAAYSPDGKKIAMTMSFLGDPEIFILEPKTSTVTRLSKSMGFDVDPAWSPDGKRMAFVSSRTGMPMVFAMDADGGEVKRLTYAGRYNATPSWSRRGDKMVFAGWLDNVFDVFLMNPDGTKIERLTKGQGSNEDPGFSPDGNFIVFSSNRTGQQNIYVMNLDGVGIRRLTYGMGNCVSPRWSNPPKP